MAVESVEPTAPTASSDTSYAPGGAPNAPSSAPSPPPVPPAEAQQNNNNNGMPPPPAPGYPAAYPAYPQQSYGYPSYPPAAPGYAAYPMQGYGYPPAPQPTYAHGQPIAVGQPVMAQQIQVVSAASGSAQLPMGAPRRLNVAALVHSILGLFGSYVSRYGSAPSLLICIAAGMYVCNCCTTPYNRKQISLAISILHVISVILLIIVVILHLVYIADVTKSSNNGNVTINDSNLATSVILGVLAFFVVFWSGLAILSAVAAYSTSKVFKMYGRNGQGM